VTAVLVLLLAACSTAGGDTTTTAPLAEPSTTTTTAPATTATQATPTTSEEECVERDGVLRDGRGFICPPFLTAGPEGHFYLPGEYETRLFQPRLRFSRTDRFESDGENAERAGLDNPPPIDGIPPITSRIDAYTGDTALAVADLPDNSPSNRPDDWEWTADARTSGMQIGGVTAHLTTFTAVCLDEPEFTDPICSFLMPGPDPWSHVHGAVISIVEIDTAEHLTIIVEAGRDFDTYWTETAQPILDSIEFLDP
jgi:hypothetical protein